MGHVKDGGSRERWWGARQPVETRFSRVSMQLCSIVCNIFHRKLY